jgi:hypothetical protein
MESGEETRALRGEIERSLIERFLKEHHAIKVLMLAETEEIRGWLVNLIRRFIDEGEAGVVGLLALWLVVNSPKDILINLAVWLETEGSPGEETGFPDSPAGDDKVSEGKRARARHCPKDAHLRAFAEETLRPGAWRKIETHLFGCNGCRQALTLLTRTTGDDHSQPVAGMETAVGDPTGRVVLMSERDARQTPRRVSDPRVRSTPRRNRRSPDAGSQDAGDLQQGRNSTGKGAASLPLEPDEETTES